QNVVRGRENARSLAVLSGGTIPDRGYYGVYIHGSSAKLGEMDEEFVYESRVGDVFLLGTATWRIEAIEHDRITVSEAFGQIPKLPFWHGDGAGRPYSMGLKIGAFIRTVGSRLEEPGLPHWLAEECALAPGAAENLVNYLQEQQEATGVLPTDRQVVAEYFWDETGDRRLMLLTPFGRRVHLAWATLLKRRIRDLMGLEAEMFQTDDGLLIRLPGADRPPDVARLLRISPAEAESLLLEEIGNTPLFGAHFRMNAGRSLVLPRPRPGRRQPFWLQRLRAADLLQIARRYDSFPVVLETYREVLKDVLDVDGLMAVLTGLESGAIGLQSVETEAPSPMAAAMFMGFVGAYMYEGETPKAERRGALLNLNRELLREVLGTEQLRHLLDPRAIAEVNARHQRLDADWQPRNPDETEELLRHLGDLTTDELAERGVQPAWRQTLVEQRRAVSLLIGGEERWVAAEHRAIYADPRGGAGTIIRRFAMNRGPFVPEAVAVRYGYDLQTVHRYLAVLQAEGILSAGEYTPGVSGREYCDTEVLQEIHRRTLALLRREVEPVDGATYARFLARWQGLGAGDGPAPATAGRSAARGIHALRQALSRLQGVALPAEAWEQQILPARVPGYQPLWLDQLAATGELYWVVRNGGKVAFYLSEQADLLSTAEAPPDLSPEAQAVLGALTTSGADFLGGIARTAGLPPAAALEALWSLTQAGLVTNDTFAPMRQALRVAAAKGSRSKGIPLAAGTGRWSLVARLTVPGANTAEAYAHALLHRYGVVTREAVQGEDGPATWGEVATVLKRMEMLGEVRRGYFLRDLSGLQFALPEAVEQLRAARTDEQNPDHTALLLAACDPANPYGAILPSPTEARVSRLPSAYLVLEGGMPVLAVESQGRRLQPLTDFTDAQLQAALTALKGLLALPGGSRALRRIAVEFWGDEPIMQSAVAPILQAVGFEREPTRLVLYR
ncbi:MAG: DEAD/DEAH box helicase, partial [Mycobacterium leprae]